MKRNALHLILLPLFMAISLAVNADVDVTLKFHYNGYPLCNWEVEIKHNDAPIGRGVTDNQGIVVFEDVFLPSKEVNAYLYQMPKSGDGRWNAQGYILLDHDYYGELDFGPIVATSDAPKSALEEAWGISLYECDPLTESDNTGIDDTTSTAHTPYEESTVRSEKPERTRKVEVDEATEEVDDVKIALEELTANDYQRRIDSLKEEQEKVKVTLKDLETAGEPGDDLGNRIYKAMMDELDLQKQWLDKKMTLLKYRSKGKEVGGIPYEEKALRTRYQAARNIRQNLQHQARKTIVEEVDETGTTTPARFEKRVSKLQADLEIKKQALVNEENSGSPDSKRIAQLKGEIERLERKIDDLME